MHLSIWLTIILLSTACVSEQLTITIPVLYDSFGTPNPDFDPMVWGFEDVQARGLLPNVTVEWKYYAVPPLQIASSVDKTIDIIEEGHTLILGNSYGTTFLSTGIVGGVYGAAQLSATAAPAFLSDKALYPFVSRVAASTAIQTSAMAAFIDHFNTVYPTYGWNRLAIILSADGVGQSLYEQFLINIPKHIEVRSVQAILPDQVDMSIEFTTIKQSGARLIVCLSSQINLYNTIAEAKQAGIIGPNYVWIVSDLFLVTPFYFNFSTSPPSVIPEMVENLRGFIGTNPYIPRVDEPGNPYHALVSRYATFIPPEGSVLSYDLGMLVAYMLDTAYNLGILFQDFISAQTWSDLVRSTTFDGASGPVRLESNGDRIANYTLKNFIPEHSSQRWVDIGVWNVETGNVDFLEREIIWPSNSTEVPDLDIRPPFRYWSCDKKDYRWDMTGKTIEIQTPDSSNVDEIDSDYYCDGFIDCRNLSDEGSDCSTNYTVLFICVGIITGVLILIAILFIPHVIIFGVILRRTRVTAASPVFLLILILSGIVGYCSTFAWYGKPNAVACGFQPWLLGLSVVSMVGALSAKTFRIWRIFKSPFTRVVITDLELIILWGVVVAPAVAILALWTLISTPTAEMTERHGNEHYVCATGGFTGYPGGYVFFAIFVGYLVVVISAALFLSIVTRKVPTVFNESRLIAISIYNITILGFVVIPTVLVVQEFNPFVAWIIRTVAILYGFTATLWLQFLPQMFGLLVFDKCGSRRMLHKSSMDWISEKNRSGSESDSIIKISEGSSSSIPL